MSVVTIATPGSFNFAATVESHGWYLLAPFDWDREQDVLRRPERLASGRVVDLEIRWNGALQLSSAADLRPLRSEFLPRLTRMFQLGVDLEEFHRLCMRTETHRATAEARFGRLLCGSTLFEDVAKVIATTNTTWGQTKRMVRLLVDRFGEASPGGKTAFPAADRIAAASAEEIRRECRMGYRAAYLIEAARLLQDSVRYHDIGSTETPELFRLYRELPGIGPYGAAHLLAMEGRHDFIAVDTEFRRFVGERYHGGRKVSDKTLLKRYSRWGRWKYLAYWSELWGAVAEEVDREGPL